MIKKLLELFRLLSINQRTEVWLVQILVIAMTLFTMIGIASFGPFMALVSNLNILDSNNLIADVYTFSNLSKPSFVLFAGLSVILLLLLSTIISVYTSWRLNFLSTRISMEVSTRIFNYYLHQSWIFHTKNSSAQLTKQIFIEARRLGDLVISPVIQIVSGTIFIFIITIALVIYNPIVAIAGISIFSMSYIIIYRWARFTLSKNGVNMTKQSVQRAQLLYDGLGGIKELLLLNRQEYFSERFKKSSDDFGRSQAVNAIISAIPKFIIETLAFSLIVLLVLYLIINKSSNLDNALPILSVYALVGFKLLPSFQLVFSNLAKVKGNFSSFDIIKDDLIGSFNYEQSNNNNIEQNEINFINRIDINGLYYKYPQKREYVIKDITFSIKKNQTVGFVGFSGSGKTTLIDLILMLLKPMKGYIEIDGVKLNDASKKNWQKKIGFVSQSIFLSDDSLKANIAFGVNEQDIDLNMIYNCIELAQLTDVVNDLPDGIQTRVGERGVQLSGGQRQRIGIARSLYANAELLVFDEATSALDGVTEKVVLQSISNFTGSKTIIMIAHRLTTLINCDIIYILEKGKLINKGTYEELLVKDDTFKRMAKGIK
jgi:ATP-binding cassette, subfamily B, bacterial PglK